MRAAGWAGLLSLAALACTPLRTMPPDTGSAGAGGTAAGAAGAGPGGAGGDAGGGGAGTTGSGGGAGTGGAGGAGGTTVEPGLIAYWRFNEDSGSTVADSSGNGQSLTISTTQGWTTAGHEGAAFAFDGADDVAGVTPLDSQPLFHYPTVPLSFSAWVRPTAAAASRPFATAVARSHEDYAFQDFWLGLIDGRPACTIHSPTREGAVASTVAPTTTWTHLACTYGLTAEVTLYVNGVSVATASTNQQLGPIETAILVGASETTGREDFFPGAIDDVRIYNRTLTATEIAAIAR